MPLRQEVWSYHQSEQSWTVAECFAGVPKQVPARRPRSPDELAPRGTARVEDHPHTWRARLRNRQRNPADRYWRNRRRCWVLFRVDYLAAMETSELRRALYVSACRTAGR